MAENKEINASISCMGYGYTVKIIINGVDIGVKGGQSESKRLFNTDHPMFNEAPEEMRSRLFVLKHGENTIHIECKKTGTDTQGAQGADKVTFEMYLEEQTEPFLLYTTTDPAGTFDKTFSL